MLATMSSAVVSGVDGHPVSVEVHAGNGLPSFTIVGLPDTSCREARDRVRAAILSSGLTWPVQRVTVNLAPSDIRKVGAGLDLPIALCVLAASKQIEAHQLIGVGAVGELGLDGSLRSVNGLVSMAAAVACTDLIVPVGRSAEAALVRPGSVREASHLRQVVDGLTGDGPLPPLVELSGTVENLDRRPELADVRGQAIARLALEIAAAGGHHLLMVGSPGAGKTMLAHRLVGLLPDLDPADALTVTKIHSVAGVIGPIQGLVLRPPFRAPHHGASAVALIGGGTSAIRPGEISLSHSGVLFLDELGEFPVVVLEALRQPLEEGVVRVSRAAASATMPARFQLVAAMNPCPCGEGFGAGQCRCSDAARARYARRLSGPLLDRFDLRIEVAPPDPALLLGRPVEDSRSGSTAQGSTVQGSTSQGSTSQGSTAQGALGEESTAVVGARVAKARAIARCRGVRSNAELAVEQLDKVAALSPGARRVAERSLAAGELTGRGLRRARTVALTIADLRGDEGPVDADDLQLALSLRVRPFSVLGVGR